MDGGSPSGQEVDAELCGVGVIQNEVLGSPVKFILFILNFQILLKTQEGKYDESTKANQGN